jgi:coenzyme PQQ synthesis protein D (PqqD)
VRGCPISHETDHTRRWKRDERTLSRAAPGLLVLLGPDGGAPVVLRGTGVAVWLALDQPHSTEELGNRLAAEFDTDSAAITSDIEPMIVRLGAIGVLRPVP